MTLIVLAVIFPMMVHEGMIDGSCSRESEFLYDERQIKDLTPLFRSERCFRGLSMFSINMQFENGISSGHDDSGEEMTNLFS